MAGIRELVAAAALAALAAAARADAPSGGVASQAGKGVLVLQVGSDWCVSGEAVRKVFDSKEFRQAVGQKFTFAVYDVMDNPDAATEAANVRVEQSVVKTKRFPAVTCLTASPSRFFGQIENIPSGWTADKFATAVLRLAKRKDEAEALFRQGAQLRSQKKDAEAADAYGRGFDILVRQAGDFNAKAVRTGKLGYSQEWSALAELDAGDRFGWVKHFEMDEYETVKMVESVTKARGSGAAAGIVERIKKVPQEHFTANQKQCVKVMEYALTGKTGGPLSPGEKKLLQEAFAMGRGTFWGQFAMGRLMMDGEKIESRGLKGAPVRDRATARAGASAPFALEQAKGELSGIKPGAKLTERQKLAVARYAVLRAVGSAGWGRLVARPGAEQFVKAFMNDRAWLEDFAWSGAPDGEWADALLALESLVFQDNGRWAKFADGRYADNEGRRFMTALALVYPGAGEAWLADVLDAYRATAQAGRLHRTAYSQPVWLWRFAVHQGHRSASVDNMAAQQRHLDKFVNLPLKEYGGTCWMVAYRGENCFGDSVQGPLYYKPWATAGEWPKRKYSQIIGGVCGELSKFGSATGNAHGLPSTTAGQPGHCAYTRRLPGGKWEIDYSVTGHSQMHMCFWGRHEWQYSAAIESTYGGDREKRLGAERMLALAALAEESSRDAKTVEALYRYACASHSGHYGAWKAYGDWLSRAGTPLDKLRVWVRGCARGLKTGRQPLWDFLTPYFKRVAKEKGAKALADDLVAFAPNLRQDASRLQEEADFGKVLAGWAAPLEGDAQLRGDVLKAMLAAQYGTPDYFSQTLGWGSDVFMKTPEGVQAFVKCIGDVLQAKAKDGEKPALDFKPLILAASRSGNLDAFRQMADLQARIAPSPAKGKPYPQNDFGGVLLGGEGLLATSSTCQWDDPSRYAYAIDASPAGGNAFHTAKEKAPWAQVMLKGPSAVAGVVVENRRGGYNGTRQVPLYVDVSEDGSSWRRVRVENEAKATFRIDLSAEAPRARYVRVGRVADAKDEVFHLDKILVYGRKLY